MAQINTHLAKHLDQVAVAFRDGGGGPYAEFRPELTDVLDAAGRGLYDAILVDARVPVVPGLSERLTAGACVADVGCGTGHAVVLIARAFPASTFVGFDIAEDAIERAGAEAASEGLTNATFEVRDAASLTVDEPFDVVFTIDAIHDQAHPADVLSPIFAALVPGGTYVMAEPAASSSLEDNLANPLAPWIYGISTLHCMTVSLAEGGAGLGPAWGWQRAHRMLAEAGFGAVTMFDAPGDPFDTIHVAGKP
ncbi:MAG: class I SAM-dependent methyltransferase [Acidimicrobiales bacterium]